MTGWRGWADAMAAIVPLDPLRRIELQRLTEDNGFGLPQGEADGWARFSGLAISHLLHVAHTDDGRWLVGMAHSGVMEAVAGDNSADGLPCPDGSVAVAVAELGPTIRRIAQLARSLPTAPLDAFVAQIRALPRKTEAERLVVQRVGQDVFRATLLDFWNARCPLTGIAHPRILRASHMKPWADCDSDAERLDVHNGLLLAAHLDAAFDAGLITFADDGTLLTASALSAADSVRLGLPDLPPLTGLTANHLPYLQYHRDVVFSGHCNRGGNGGR
jgi:putative restriction endonuclease